ncbi:MAG: hypothetical protein ACI85O_000747 [Saprospiraceae bacterium]|jgi:uncharacterized protein YbaP (TraB family)
MNPLKTILFLSISLFSLTLFGQEIDRSNYSLLWEITGKNLSQPSYLYGTMHVQDERAHDFPDSLFIALESAEAFALEVDPDSTINGMMKELLGQEYENTLKEKMSATAYEKLTVEFFDLTGMSLDSFAMFNGEDKIASELIPFSEPADVVKKQNAVDFYLYQCAFRADKSLHGLETMSDYQSTNDALFKVFEQENVPSFGMSEERRREQYETMIKMYQEGDTEAMYAYTTKDKTYEEYSVAMLDTRNMKMTEGVVDLLKTKKSVFAAIGAAHLGGEIGVVKLLRAKGYTLRKMQPVFTGKANNYKLKNKRSREWTSHQIKGSQIQLDFPLQPEKMNSEDDEMSQFLSLHGVVDFVEMNGYMVMVINSPTGVMDMSDAQLKDMAKEMSKSVSPKKSKKLKKIKSPEGLSGFENSFVDVEGNYHTQQIFSDKKAVYVLWYMRLLSENPTADKERFFNSFQIIDLPSPPPGILSEIGYDFENLTQGYSIKMPRKPFEKTTYQTVEVFEGRTGTMKITQNVSVSVKGETFMVQHILRPLGQKTENDSVAVASTAAVINSRNKVLKEPQYFERKDIVGVEMHNEISGGKEMRSRAIARGPHNYFIAFSGEDVYSETAENFFNSFQLLPFQEEEMNDFISEDKEYSIELPEQYFVSTTGRNEEEGILDVNELVALDTLSGISYVITRTTYLPYIEFGDKDSYLQSVIDKNADLAKAKLLSRTEENGISKLKLDMLSPDTETYTLAQLFHVGNTEYELNASLPSDEYIASAERFFASFQLNNQADSDLLFKSKSEVILKDLTSKEEEISNRAIEAINEYSFSADNLPTIRKILTDDNYHQDTIEGLLLREFVYNFDEESLPFIEEYFTKNKPAGLSAQRYILMAMNAQPTEVGRKTFFKYANDWEKNAERQYFDYEDIFTPYYDSPSLFLAHLEDLMPLLEHQQFAVELANILSFHAKSMKDDRDILITKREIIFAKAQQIVTKYNLFSDPKASTDFEEYRLFDALNFYLTDVPTTPEIEDYFKDFYKFDEAYLILGAIRYYASEQIPFNPIMVKKVYDSPYDRIYLFRYAENYFGDLKMLPQEYVSQETVTEAYVYESIYDEYGLLSAYKPMKTQEYKKGDKEYLLYPFTFKLEGNDGEYFGAVSQPMDGSENVFPDLFNYHTGAWDKSRTEEMLQEIKDYWEKED